MSQVSFCDYPLQSWEECLRSKGVSDGNRLIIYRDSHWLWRNGYRRLVQVASE